MSTCRSAAASATASLAIGTSIRRKSEIRYGGAVAEGNVSVAMTDIFSTPIPHWCYPGEVAATVCLQPFPVREFGRLD